MLDRFNCASSVIRSQLSVAIGLCIQALSAFAAPSATEGGTAETLISWKSNYQSLSEQEPYKAGDPVFDSLMGQVAYRAGHFTRSVMAWERVVALQPENQQAREGLMQALRAVGDRDALSMHAAHLNRIPQVANATRTDDSFFVAFDALDHIGASNWKGYVEAGIGKDSNMNSGPNDPRLSGTTADGVTQWALSPDLLARSERFGQLEVAFSGRYVIDPRWSVIGGMGFVRRQYLRNEAGSAKEYHRGQFGLAYLYGRNDFSLGWIDHLEKNEAQKSRHTKGPELGWIYRIDGHHQFASFAQKLEVKHPSRENRDNSRIVIGTTYMNFSPYGNLGFAGVYAGNERHLSKSDNINNDLALFGFRMGYQWQLSGNWSFGFSLLQENRRHEIEDLFFGPRRHDKQTELNINASWIPVPKWRLTGLIGYIDNRSNIAPSAYRRNQFSISLRREF